jgi:dihydrofolate reductase
VDDPVAGLSADSSGARVDLAATGSTRQRECRLGRQPSRYGEELAMRKIAAGLFISLDGVVEAPDKWTGPYFSPEVGEAVGALMAGHDTLLLGRVTYQGFAEAFGGQSGGVADQMNSTRKVVVSTTLDRADWQNSTVISGDVAGEITRLKEQPGKGIGMSGSATLVAWLLRQGLLDQLDLLVFPIVLGRGQRLFQAEGDQVALSLAGSRAFGNGVLHLTYHPA